MKNESNTGNSQRVMRAARLLVLSASVIGFIGATVSPAAASWQRTTFKGTPGEVILINYRAAEGGICGDTTPGVTDPSNCTQNFNWIFIDRFWVSTAPYSVFQTIRVDAYLYQYNFQNNSWTLAIAFPHTEISPSSIHPFSNLGWNFGSPASDVASCIPLGCTPAFVRIPKGGAAIRSCSRSSG